MIKVAMFGLSGQNTRLWLDFFSIHKNEYSLDFFCPEYAINGVKWGKYKVKVFEHRKKFRVELLNKIRYKLIYFKYKRGYLFFPQYDILIMQGLYNVHLGPAWYFGIRARKKVVILWNNTSHRRIKDSDIERTSEVYSMLDNCDRIFATWKPTGDDFCSCFPEFHQKVEVKLWGFPESLFNLKYQPNSKVSKSLLNDVLEKDILLFWPRTIQPNVRHDKLLLALKRIENRENIKTILLTGNPPNSEWVEHILALIKHLDLKNVKIVYGEHIPIEDILRIHNRANILINIADSDQLSACIIEGLARKTRLILSDIPQYKEMEKFGLKIKYVSNEIGNIVNAIEECADSCNTKQSLEEIEQNYLITRKLFDLDRNLHLLLSSIQTSE